ncbi:hypothetical protein [Paraburkholderia diazotrophica]|uniref:hypothetical protein n=1 Tax=Paraburkholderia diazotrophica TaxID=667676 RepID=UPI0031717152
MDDSSLQVPSTNSRVGANQVTQGSIDSSQTSGAITKGASIPPSVVQQPAAPAPAPTPKKAAPESAPPAAQAMTQPQPAAPAPQMTAPQQPAEPTVQALTQPQPAAPAPQAPQAAAPAAQAAPAPRPAAQPKQAPSTAVASVNARDSSRVKVSPAPRAQREREDLERRVMMLQQGATPETEQLVRESAKLDPSLPAPDMSALRSTPEVRAPYQSNPPTIGTTGQPVRESKADPALPPPDTTATRAAMSRAATTDQPVSSRSGTHSNPVAAAMTDQLVKGSAMLDPSLPPPK